MSKVLEKFVAQLVWEVNDNDLKETEKQGKKTAKSLSEGFKNAAKAIKSVAKATAAASAAVSGFLFLTNKHTAIETNRARAFGQSAATIDALGYAMSNMGIDEERVIDLTKEMNAKMGEFIHLGEASDRMSQAFGQVRDVITLTGLSLEEIENMDPAAQFIEIASAMQSMENLQGAQAAAKILFGEEGTKIIGFLRQYPKSLRDIIQQYKALSVLTDEGRQGAVDFFREFNEGKAVLVTLGQELAGLTGKALIPLIKEFKEWVIQNRKVLRQKIRIWAVRLARAVTRLVRVLEKALNVIIPLGEALYDFRGVIQGLAMAIAAFKIAKWLTLVGSFKGLLTAIGGVPTIVIGGLIAFFLLIDDLVGAAQGKKSIFGDLMQVLNWKDIPEWMKVMREILRGIASIKDWAIFGGKGFNLTNSVAEQVGMGYRVNPTQPRPRDMAGPSMQTQAVEQNSYYIDQRGNSNPDMVRGMRRILQGYHVEERQKRDFDLYYKNKTGAVY